MMIECELIGSLEFHPWCKMFEQLRRVYGVGGICPALNANGGGASGGKGLGGVLCVMR